MSLSVQFVKVRQNLFISGDSEPGYVPQAYPEIPIINEQSTTQKYLNYGKQPFLTKLWQVISMALAIRNSPKLCLVFFYKKRTEINPPIRPATRGIYLCFSSLMHRLSAQRMLLNSKTKLPTNSPKLIASFPVSIFNKCEGLLNIFLMPNTVDSPDFIRQLSSDIFVLSFTMDYKQLLLCLQVAVLDIGI